MKKGILSFMVWSLPLLLLAQSNTTTQSVRTKDGTGIEEGKGIKWTTGLSWEQIKQKAKAENKYIFIDAYTTWCAPCKMMDKYVYPNDTVGDFFNKHFIAVKTQIDKTDKDEQAIKDWYNDSKRIEGEYDITAYPSLIFLSPESTPLYKIEGFRPVQKFVDTAKLVLTNGTVYNDPFKEYRSLVSKYKQGVKHYDRMPYMIQSAFKLNDIDLAREMFIDHLNYASGLNETDRYTKENIELWSSYVLKLDSKALQFFLKDSNKIDKVMGQKGFSARAVDKTIRGRIVDSFFRMQKGETMTATGTKISNSEIMFMRLPERADGKIEPDPVEADWNTLKKMIGEHFSNNYITRNVFLAKLRWYEKHQNKASESKTYFSHLDKYPPEDLFRESDFMNEIAWQTFLYSNDKKLLKKALEWMKRVIGLRANDAGKIDTYAMLLYKLGQTKEAIRWEEKAVSIQTKLAGEDKPNSFKKVVEKMKKGEPTYLDEGAIWSK